MKELKFIGVSKASEDIHKKIGVLFPVGTYFNSCTRSKLDYLYLDKEGNFVHDITFNENDLKVYEKINHMEYQYQQ